MSSGMQNNLINLIKKIESRANYLYKYHYRKYIHITYNNLIVENLMCNGRCHLVAVFKNYLIEDDNSEYLRRFYKSKESGPRLKKLFLYHEETSVIFPNYTPLVESKYLYNNVIRKQRVIDEQQDLENKRNDLKLKKKNKEMLKKDEKVFNSTVFGEILTSSESVLRILFGIENNNNKKVSMKHTIDHSKKNDDKNNNRNDIDDDESDCEAFKQLIKEVENAEENMKIENNNSLVGYKLNSNNALKYKLKLINNSNNNQIKSKNYDKMNSVTNNSTNITSSSNNINVNINLNKIKNNNNLSFKDSFLLSKNGLKLNHTIRNSLTVINPNNPKNNNNEKEIYKNSLTIQTHKKSNSTIPSRTLYGLNFHQNRNIINNIINQEKKPSLKSNSNSHSNNTSRITNINIYNNNYIYNNNFPHNGKCLDKKNNLLNSNNNSNNNTKFNSSNKSNKAFAKIPKIDLHRLDIINNNGNNNNNKLLTLTNRNLNSNRNHNYILNNPNLFFAETEVLKTERNIMKKKNQKKDLIKSIISPMITFSPTNHVRKSKVIFGRNSHTKLVVINDQNTNNIKSVSQKKNKQYFSNKNINKSTKKLITNDYNYKVNTHIINKGNLTNRYHKKNSNHNGP